VASNVEGVRYSSPANLYVRGRDPVWRPAADSNSSHCVTDFLLRKRDDPCVSASCPVSVASGSSRHFLLTRRDDPCVSASCPVSVASGS